MKTMVQVAAALAAAAVVFAYNDDDGVAPTSLGRCDFVVPEGTSGKITATKHNWVPAQTTFVAE